MQEIDKVIERYTCGIADVEDLKSLSAWLRNNPDNKKELFLRKDLWDASSLGSSPLKELENKEWERLERKISRQLNIRKFRREFIKYAAIVIFTFGVGWFSHFFIANGILSTKKTEWHQIESTKGQLKEIFLADGTHLWLNSDSHISFPTDFSADNRKVILSGEAYFDVTSNPERPFIVETGKHKVKVTGTQFNICEYTESDIIETTLVEGQVQIMTGNIIKDLLPGQQSSFNTKTAQIRISQKDFEVYTSWRDGRYELKNEEIGKLFQIVERWWDVKINCTDESIKKERISGVLKRHKPMEQLFPLIEQLVPIKYEIENNVINVYPK